MTTPRAQLALTMLLQCGVLNALWTVDAIAQAPDLHPPTAPLWIAVDLDDDDLDGTPDAQQQLEVPTDDLLRLDIPRGAEHISVRGPLRLIEAGQPRAEILVGDHPTAALLQAIRLPGPDEEPPAVIFRVDGRDLIYRVAPIELSFIGHDGRPLVPARDALGVSRRIPNDRGLPRGASSSSAPEAPEAFRVQARGQIADGGVRLLSFPTGSAHPRSSPLTLPLTSSLADSSAESPWLRVVSNPMDARAPGVSGRLLLADLGDRVRIEYSIADARLTQDIRVGVMHGPMGPRRALRGRLRVRVLRMRAGGPPVIGRDDAHAIAIARRQITIANDVWAQCFVGFGPAETADVQLVDPPTTSLISVADEDGLPASGGGVIRIRAGDQLINLPTRRGALPTTTAMDIAETLRGRGFQAQVFENVPAEHGAHGSADVVARDSSGEAVPLTRDGTTPLSTDRQQRVSLGEVQLGDGLNEFDNHIALSGTLEERALLRALIDDDPTTIDVIIVNRFTRGTRRGEAFIEADGSAFANTVILDRGGLQAQQSSWTQAHEIGHVLLDDPYHPDDHGPDRPWLLMDSNAREGTTRGPRRIPWASCVRARARSGPTARPTLLRLLDR